MRLKLALVNPGGVDRMVSIVADATATIGDVATTLVRSDPLRGRASGAAAPRCTLRVHADPGRSGQVVDHQATIHEAGLRSGARVEVVDAGGMPTGPGTSRGPAAAVVRVVAGVDAGREFDVPVGTSYIGRSADVDIRLSDPLVSGRHARLAIGGSIELIDLNSANGMILGGQPVSRVSLTATDQVMLGNTVISVTSLHKSSSLSGTGSVVEFNRAPRVVARFKPHKVVPPTPPQVQQKMRFPLLAIIAPFVMGVVLFAVTKNLLSVVFVALSPLLMVGTWLDQRLTNKRLFKAQRGQFLEAVAHTAELIQREHAVERAVRSSRCLSAAETLQSVAALDEQLWSRRPESPDFLGLRLGVGTSPSVLELDLPAQNTGDKDSWESLLALRADCETLIDAPVLVNLRECGSLGVAGPADAATGVARGLVWQLVGQHAPSELVVVALMSRVSRVGWEWLEWLPHEDSPHSPLQGDHLADDQASGAALVARLDELVATRLSVSEDASALRGPLDPENELELAAPVLPCVVVLVADDAPVDRARLTQLMERGPGVGVHVIWIAAALGTLPGACRSFVKLSEDSAGGIAPGGVGQARPLGCSASVGQVRWGLHTYPVWCELVDEVTCMRAARALTPVVDAGALVEDASDLPRSLSYLTLAGLEFASQPDFVAERWAQTFSLNPREPGAKQARHKPGGLLALVGQDAAGPLSIDLRSQGPHALVGGTTGAGKSEFLQAWVMGLATRYSPDRVTFLFVDYKGGSAFAECVELPHCVGLVTDLSPHLVRRALTSFRAELRYREHLLNRKKAKDLISLERTGDPETPPSLIIVVDEFAALVQEVPDFLDGVVDVAQRGRSLGLHLILATQRPAGVIKGSLRANTNLRIALRMADEADSEDVLGDKLAAHVDPAIPGRAIAKTGPGRLAPFQTGYVGGWTTGEPEPPRIDITELDFGAVGTWELPQLPEGDPESAKPAGPTDIARMVSTVKLAAATCGVPEPRRPWLNSLAAVYDLAKLPGYRDDQRLVLGVLDDPANQRQPVAYYEPDVHGNLAILGAGGSGKSTALRTIAISATFATRNGGPIHVYGMDFGSGGLQMLSALPHVGAVIPGDDEERITRLLRTLRATVDDRAVRYAKVSASNIVEYRSLAGLPDEPRVLLLLDGMSAFRQEYEFTALSGWFTAFAQIAADGRPLGVHVIMTGDRPGSIPASISSTVQRRVVLRMASEDDYLALGVPKDALDATAPPGRGFIDDNEIQFAVWGADPNLAVQARETASLAETASRRRQFEVPGIERLSDQIELAELPASDDAGWPVFAVADDTLGPLAVEPKGALLVAGPPASGRTTALLAIAEGVVRRGDMRPILLAPRRTVLRDRLAWSKAACGADAVGALAEELAEELGADDAARGRYAIFLDSVTEFGDPMVEALLDRLIQAAVRSDQFVVGEGESSTWQQAYNVNRVFKAARRGLILVPGPMDTDNLTGVSVGRIRTADFPPGRGFLIGGGRYRKVQVALPSR